MIFKDWLMEKFIAWERTQKRRQSFSAFARYLDVKQASLSQWMNGNYTPTGDNLLKVAAKLGDEVYVILGYKEPGEPDLDALPPRLRSALEESRDKIIAAGVAGDSNEAESIFIETMAKFGYTFTSKSDDESAK